jgi:hypothetical protein
MHRGRTGSLRLPMVLYVCDDGPWPSVALFLPHMLGIVVVWLRLSSCSSHQLCALDATASLLLQDAQGLDARGRILTDLLRL